MGGETFDIYQTNAGYCAVQNPIQRQILEALTAEDLQLPRLVELTGRTKSTLSGIHIKELIARELIEERVHPQDKRRKIYASIAQRIGSSDVPVPDLRDAVRRYVSLTPMAGHLATSVAIAAICQVPAKASVGPLWHQAAYLGEHAGAGRFKDDREAWMRLARYLEDQRIARMLKLDLEGPELVVGPLMEGAPAASAAAIAGFVHGAMKAAGLSPGKVIGETLPGGEVRLSVVRSQTFVRVRTN